MSTDQRGQALADQDLLHIVNQICEAYLHTGPASAVADRADPPASSTTTIIAAVSITGAWDGHIRLGCAVQTATDIAARMLDIDAEHIAADDIDDALGELINILGGNIKCLLPRPAQVGPPVVAGPPDVVRFPDSHRIHHLPLRWNDQPMELSILATART